MQQYKFFTALLLLYCGPTLSGQKIDLVLKGGYNYLVRDFDEGGLRVEYTGDQAGAGKGLGLSASIRYKKHFRLGLEGGFNRSMDDLSMVKTEAGSCVKITISGDYKIGQYYLALVPEWRFFEKEWLFVNLGLGYFNDQKSGFSAGGTYRFFNCIDDDIFDIQRLNNDYRRKSKLGSFLGAGVCPPLGKRFYLLGELRLMLLPSGTFSPDQITLRYHYLNANVGIGFRI